VRTGYQGEVRTRSGGVSMARKEWIYDKNLHDYSSSNWKKLRDIVFNRDEGKCVECKLVLVLKSPKHARIKNKANIHHIVERVNGGKDAEENLITLCTKCHSKAHKEGLQYGSKEDD
jgi:5-methylcytosine-specific restriction endonuclease McrA